MYAYESYVFADITGGKRTLKLPPQLGYGMRGAGCKGGKKFFGSLAPI